MLRKRRGAGKTPPQLDHAAVQRLLLDYSYGRLPDAEEALLEEHVRVCEWCREEDFRHLATERMRALQQRPKVRRQGPPKMLMALLSVILGLMLGSSGFLVYSGVQNGALRALLHVQAPVVARPAATPTRSAAPAVAPSSLQPGGTIGKKTIVTIAWSPDGTALATGANPDAASNNPGGVIIYRRDGHTTSLPGFDGFSAPGTIAWSPDGARVAASGHLTLYAWDAVSGTQAARINLPQTPGTNLYIFDAMSGTTVGSVPASAFAASGFMQWTTNGQVIAAPTNAAGAANIPALHSAIIALWGNQQGIRIFRDASNTAFIGMNDADIQAHAALLRWSPDHHYLLWGYPRVPISSTVIVATTASTHGQTAVDSPNAAVASLVNQLGQAANTQASIIIWPAADGTRLAVYNGITNATTPGPVYAILDATTGAPLNTCACAPPATILLNALSWQSLNPIAIAFASGKAPVTQFSAPPGG